MWYKACCVESKQAAYFEVKVLGATDLERLYFTTACKLSALPLLLLVCRSPSLFYRSVSVFFSAPPPPPPPFSYLNDAHFSFYITISFVIYPHPVFLLIQLLELIYLLLALHNGILSYSFYHTYAAVFFATRTVFTPRLILLAVVVVVVCLCNVFLRVFTLPVL